MLASTVNSQQSTVNSQQSTVNSQQSTVNSQQSTVNSHLSPLSFLSSLPYLHSDWLFFELEITTTYLELL
ncbi:hypothetical protein H6G33_06850 [Calothrix sp. FACHB-1219]|uniref:hypothetical protein n=1 Tax=unclassified Calothrix TaxID=2619626 RepID=UPI001688D6DA|nr:MULTISPECIES: hypothetical protein [unclassified Calothrix]MBD2204374.1 hypothetical protein [Calothrix sp. FACHB-168]MBD2216747.1 hypothetical protein [Calothrix sp. FACHB-1219]